MLVMSPHAHNNIVLGIAPLALYFGVIFSHDNVVTRGLATT